MAWTEVVAKRGRGSRLYADGVLRRVAATTATIHYPSILDSGKFDAQIDLRPERITDLTVDGWKSEQAGYHLRIGDIAGKEGDGWMLYGPRSGECSIAMRPYRMGFFDWATRNFQDIGGEAAFDRDRHEQIVTPLIIGPNRDEIFRYVINRWRGVWNVPKGCNVTLEAAAYGDGIKPNIYLDEAAREWVATQQTITARASSIYFGFLYQLDIASMPLISRDGMTLSKFEVISDDGRPLQFYNRDGRPLATMPVDRLTAGDGRGTDGNAMLRKVIWYKGGVWWLFVGINTANMEKLKPGALRFDPTLTDETASGAGTCAGGTVWYGDTWLGCDSGTSEDGILIFDGITLAGTISSASIEVYPAQLYGSPQLKVVACTTDNPTMPASCTQFNALSQGAEGVDWDGPFTTGAYRTSPDIADVLQEIVDAHEVDNENIGIFLLDDLASGSNDCRIDESTNPPLLTAEYTTGGTTHDLTAVAITTGAPTLGTPALGQVHALLAAALAAGNPALGSPVIGQSHALTASGIVAGTPSIGAPAIGQGHALTVTAITTGIPAVGTPVLGQTHALTAGTVASGSPVLGAPALGQVHGLSATAIATGAPALGAPAIGQAHALMPTAITTGAPVTDAPAIGQTHTLTVTALAAGAPALGAPAIGQSHALAAGALATDTPALGAPALGQVHELTATGVASGAPAIGTPTIGQVHALTATPVTSGIPALGAPALAINTDELTADNLVTGAPAVGSPVLGQIHILVATALSTGPPALGTPALGVPVNTPTARTYTVDAESRAYVVGPESRTFLVAAESRTYTV